MKIQSRRNVFETNSSSMHSLVIRKDSGSLETNFENITRNHTMCFDEDDLSFGRYPFQLLDTVYDKLRYAIASFSEELQKEDQKDGDNSLLNQFENIVKKYIPDFQGFEFPTEIYGYDSLSEKDIQHKVDLGYTIHKTNNKTYATKTIYGYVDHESYGLLQRFLEEYNTTLESFITDPIYIVVIDGDEYCMFDELVESGVIDKNKIVLQFW